MLTTFDTYKARAARLDLTGIDLDAFRDQPLAPEALRCLRYMHDIEHHTVCYLRDLLLTPAHRDPEVTSFLACWVFEELWHGDQRKRKRRPPERAAPGVRAGRDVGGPTRWKPPGHWPDTRTRASWRPG
jgi:hypothetical protein